MSLGTEKLEISGLPAGTLRALEQIGQTNGKSAEEYARIIIEAEILSQKPFDELLQPIRDDFAASGMNDDELDALVEEERQAIWDEKHATKHLK